jgi:hypothetical protein
VALIKLFVDIVLFRKGPQDVPASQLLLGLCLLAYLLIGEVMLLLEETLLRATLQVLLDAAILTGFVTITLKIAGFGARILQTLTALLAVDALISILAFPVMISVSSGAERGGGYLLVGLMVWHLAVMAHIFRHALSRSLWVGYAVAMLYTLMSFQVLQLLFGSASST